MERAPAIVRPVALSQARGRLTAPFRAHRLKLIQGGNRDPRSPLPDDALVRAVLAGDVSAAAAFHDRLRPVVDRTLCRLIGSRDPDYDDLSQHSLIDLTLSLHRFRGECPLDAWTSIVVARVVYRHIRRRRLERRLFAASSSMDSLEPSGRSLVASVDQRSTLRQVQRHLSAIEVKKAWTFLLHDVWGYDLREVAAITGVSEAAAQSRLVRGRREIHQRIARDSELSALLDDSEEEST